MSDTRNRIIEHRVMRLGDIKVNPRNPKHHTEKQKETLAATVREIGWIGTPLVYKSERNGGALTYVDGNMRGSQYPNEEVTVAVTDLNDAEADYALLTYDPIAQMSEIAIQQVDELMRSFSSSEALVQEFIESQAASAGLYLQVDDTDPADKELPPLADPTLEGWGDQSLRVIFKFDAPEERTAFFEKLGIEEPEVDKISFVWKAYFNDEDTGSVR